MTIDWWTLGFQTVNVAVLIWLLGRFFWKPVAAMIETRKVAAQKVTDEAEAARTSATDALAEIEKTRAGIAQEREGILAAAHKTAEAAHAERLLVAETEAAAVRSNAKAAYDAEKTAQEAVWAERSVRLAVDIARRLAARLDGAVVEACFLDWLVAEIGKLPDLTRQAAGAEGLTLEAISAVERDAAAQTAIRKAIHAALGGSPEITFKTDPAVIAGIELRGDHLIVNSSWRADLDAIKTALKPEPAA